MPPEAWLIIMFAVAWPLVGAVGGLAWAIQRRSLRAEQIMERRWRTLADEVRALEKRMTELESAEQAEAGTRPRGQIKKPVFAGDRGPVRADSPSEPTLIAVPSLEPSPSDRDVSVNGLKERHAAIWALADSGAAPEVIARATGQPIGQIELILGLRRQIDATRTHFSHAPHV